MEKTLGGDRIGSGSKMKVELHHYGRSTHDIGYLWRSTMGAGTLVPFLSELALPGDTFDINLDCDIKTHPTVGPLFGSYKVQLDVYQAPIRLYQGALHNNALNIGRNMSQIKLPQIALTAEYIDPTLLAGDGIDLDNVQINPSCILSYLGLRGIGLNKDNVDDQIRTFNAIPLLAYWEIYKNYYANKQEEIGAVIHSDYTATGDTPLGIGFVGTPAGSLTGAAWIQFRPTNALNLTITPGDTIELENVYIETDQWGWVPLPQVVTTETAIVSGGTISNMMNRSAAVNVNLAARNWRMRTPADVITVAPQVITFPLSDIDDMRMAILRHPDLNTFIVNSEALDPYQLLLGTVGNTRLTQEGLAVKTYQSDLFNNWLKTENIDAISSSTAVSTIGDSFTIDQLNLSKKVYMMLNRINVSGGSYNDWLDAVYMNDRYQHSESPMYMGGLIKELVFQEVISNAATEDQPLGQLAGRGILGKKHKGGNVTIRVDEPSYILGIISITPRVDYSQGNKWDMHLKTMDDLHKPALDEIGFQDLITEQMAWWNTEYTGPGGAWVQKSAGKQPAWVNYMTNVNQVRGNFAIANNEMFMTLNRRYEPDSSGSIVDLTTYIDPAKYNFIFAETNLDAQNFWAQIAVNITARRLMSAKVMPNL